MRSFNDNCVSGITVNREKMARNLHDSLMLVTALSPHIGYEKAAEIAKKAFRENTTLKEAALASGFGDYTTYLRAFKKLFGCLPRDFS